MVHVASTSRGIQVNGIRDTLEAGGGLGLLAMLPLILFFALWGGLQSVGRSYFSRGAEHRRQRWAEKTLKCSRCSMARSIAQDINRYSQL